MSGWTVDRFALFRAKIKGDWAGIRKRRRPDLSTGRQNRHRDVVPNLGKYAVIEKNSLTNSTVEPV
jgi:hypothetical protein